MPRRGAVRRGLSDQAAQRWDLELQCGLTTFELRHMSEADAWDALRDAWDVRRDDLLARWRRDHPGERPWAWWVFDADEERPSGQRLGLVSWDAEVQTRRLVELGVVDEAELEDRRRAEARRLQNLTTGAQLGFGDNSDNEED